MDKNGKQIKRGDTLLRVGGPNDIPYKMFIGNKYKVMAVSGSCIYLEETGNESWTSSYFEIISNNSITNMTLAQKLALAFKSEPEKSFIKAGITNMDGTFTTEGQTVFLAWLLKKNGEAFKTEVVDVLIKEEEAK
jgi:hypothetical protein